ncbi:hypothetical protein L0B70_00440 [Kaistella sp. 97-N-M2]|uniref:DUF6712 family protein n=1 Tax=Kaistella sp. 97-N-M2 TaxID=2908645 RepID=UPI001F46ED96|nr:DUF6712 family protein [Kaistella sp. 97-N-M2]UJF29896.1 hypothetical protein L0B70_00440 [Kaistella sp. 97-N-M2]
MKILFNKDNAESGEILDVLGFTDADINLAKVWPYLRSASREIQTIIGEDNYTICETVGDDIDAAEDENAELYDLVRYAIALDAFRKYAPLNDLAFTNEGRLFRRDEHQVAAFQWQIDNSNDAMERRYYESVDEIINFIMDSEHLEPSDYMMQFSGLYVPNLKSFQKYVNINDSHLLYFKLAPSLRLCEQREIINRMGAKFQEYKADAMRDSYIHGLVQNICVYFAMADGIQKFSVQLFPEGLMKAGKESQANKRSASGYDKESITLFYRSELASLLKMLEIEMKKLEPVYTSKPQINFGKDDGFVTTS